MKKDGINNSYPQYLCIFEQELINFKYYLFQYCYVLTTARFSRVGNTKFWLSLGGEKYLLEKNLKKNTAKKISLQISEICLKIFHQCTVRTNIFKSIWNLIFPLRFRSVSDFVQSFFSFKKKKIPFFFAHFLFRSIHSTHAQAISKNMY